MDSRRFDSLARALTGAASRRTIAGALAGTALGNALAPAMIAKGKERRRKCKSCHKKNKDRCKKQANLGVGTICDQEKCRPGATATCSTGNDFCAQQWAYCLEIQDCGCFVTVENDPICGNILDFDGCPATTECTSSAECGGETDFCVDLSCCPQGKAACRPLCVT